MAHRDHPLNTKGISQALSLNRTWKRCLNGEGGLEGDAQVGDFLSVKNIVCSPLTRAVQTGFIALAGHPALEAEGKNMILASALREEKSLGGCDTVGVEMGQAIIDRALEQIEIELRPHMSKKLMGENNESGDGSSYDFDGWELGLNEALDEGFNLRGLRMNYDGKVDVGDTEALSLTIRNTSLVITIRNTSLVTFVIVTARLIFLL